MYKLIRAVGIRAILAGAGMALAGSRTVSEEGGTRSNACKRAQHTAGNIALIYAQHSPSIGSCSCYKDDDATFPWSCEVSVTWSD